MRGVRRATARARAMREPNITCYPSHMAATTDDEAVSLLSGVPVFETLGPRELTRVAQLAVPRRFQAGQVVFREGDASDTCYIVRRGHARAPRGHAHAAAVTPAHLRPRDVFR